jgi:hypothetical protein
MSPHVSFFICAVIGLIIASFALKMNKSIDGVHENRKTSFCKELMKNVG